MPEGKCLTGPGFATPVSAPDAPMLCPEAIARFAGLLIDGKHVPIDRNDPSRCEAIF